MLRLVRLVLVLARDVAYGQLTLRAMSLVYTTLLSLVPLLALSFSVLKAFGVYNQIQPMLLNFLAPLGEQGEDLTRRIIQFVENINVGVLGSVGLALLIYTAVSLMQKLEETFNYIWHVTQLRRLGLRFSNYLSVLVVGPVLVFSALGITATVMSTSLVRQILAIEPFGRMAYAFGQLLPYLLVAIAFTFAYLSMPNTKVRLGPALIGGVVAGFLWQSAGWGFALFAGASTQYAAIYSSFAILILFMIWLYVSWLILLLGASIAFYWQRPEYLVAEAGEPRLSNRMRERLALMVMRLVAQHHLQGRPAWTLSGLVQTLGMPMHAVEAILAALKQAGMLAETADDPPAYLPARDLGMVGVADLLAEVRAAGENRFLGPDALRVPAEVQGVLVQMEHAADEAVRGLTVKQLAESPEGPASCNSAANHCDLATEGPSATERSDSQS